MKGFSSKHFRSVEHWKSALMSLPDGSFFELLRSVFGNIKTPFNKQRLLEDLFVLLSRNEIRKTIAAYIDEQDHKVIAATAILSEPVAEDLVVFFAGEFNSAEIHALLINLEERLILYRFRDEKNRRLTLNPVLEQILTPLIEDTRLLFASFPQGSRFPLEGSPLKEKSAKAETEPPLSCRAAVIPDGRIMAALFAFILDEEELFKEEAGSPLHGATLTGTGLNGTGFREMRKKALEKGKKSFHGLDFDLAVRTFVQLGLFRQEGRGLVSNREKIEDYCSLSPIERQEYWAAGVYLCLPESGCSAHNDGLPASGLYGSAGTDEPGENSPFRFSSSRLRKIASLLHRYRYLLDPEKEYPIETLRRLWVLLQKETGGTSCLWDSFLAVMEKTGLLEKRGAFWSLSETSRASLNQKSTSGPSVDPVIVMDSAFSFVLYPEITFADALALGAFCSLKENAGTSVSFELTRKSAVRGFDEGIEAAAMLKLLDRLSGGRIDANLDFTLREWESRYAGVSLQQGIILSLAEEHRYLAEAGSVSRMIRNTLAPGVYLLSAEEKTEAIKALRKAGIDIIAQPPMETNYTWLGGFGTNGSGARRSGFSLNYFPHLNSSGTPGFMDARDSTRIGESVFPDSGSTTCLPINTAVKDNDAGDAEVIKEKFRKLLDNMKLSKHEREELHARIDRRLVLSETQLEATSLRYEKLEARGLDYAGKSTIAKQAVDTGSLVEVTWPAQDGGLNRTVGIPQTLEKKEGESILVLKVNGNSESGTRVLKIPLGKISLLRRIKQSIFGE